MPGLLSENPGGGRLENRAPAEPPSHPPPARPDRSLATLTLDPGRGPGH